MICCEYGFWLYQGQHLFHLAARRLLLALRPKQIITQTEILMTSRWSRFWPFIELHEQKVVGLLLAVFVGFNIVTAPYSPDPRLDEVCYSDPAVTLALDGHLASLAWDEHGISVWTGNVPLHQLL